jgi:hypothetical protein
MDAKAQGRVLSEEEILEIEHRQASWVLREQVNNLIATIRDRDRALEDLKASHARTVENLMRQLDERDRVIAELQDPLTHSLHCRYYTKWARGVESIMNLSDKVERLEKQNAMMLEALETYVRECRDCKDGYIDGYRCGHCWIARDTLAKVRKSAMREMWRVSEELGLYDDCEGGE